MNKKIYFVIIAIVFLIILRFGVIPNLSKTASASCAVPTLNDLLENAKLIIVGEAIAERFQTQSFFNRGMIFTYTIIGDIEVVKGKLDKTTLETRQVYGCDILTGYCVYSSAASPFEIGKRYLLFLEPALKFQPTQAKPPPATFGQNREVQDAEGEIEEGVYAGFSGCGGKYLLRPHKRI